MGPVSRPPPTSHVQNCSLKPHHAGNALQEPVGKRVSWPSTEKPSCLVRHLPECDPVSCGINELGNHRDDDEEISLRVVDGELDEDGARVLVRPPLLPQLLDVLQHLLEAPPQGVHVSTAIVERVPLPKDNGKALIYIPGRATVKSNKVTVYNAVNSK